MVPRETGNNSCAKFGGTNKESYDIFESGLLHLFYMWICFPADYRETK